MFELWFMSIGFPSSDAISIDNSGRLKEEKMEESVLEKEYSACECEPDRNTLLPFASQR